MAKPAIWRCRFCLGLVRTDDHGNIACEDCKRSLKLVDASDVFNVPEGCLLVTVGRDTPVLSPKLWHDHIAIKEINAQMIRVDGLRLLLLPRQDKAGQVLFRMRY